jgi:hypothetical protein
MMLTARQTQRRTVFLAIPEKPAFIEKLEGATQEWIASWSRWQVTPRTLNVACDGVQENKGDQQGYKV